MTNLCRAILGDGRVAREAIPQGLDVTLFDTACEQGVHLLLAHRLLERDALHRCSEELKSRLTTALRDATVIEPIVRRELQHTLAALDAEGVRPLLFKGAPLAFTHYPAPAIRPYRDIDVLINAHEIGITTAILERLGYRRPPFATGDLVSYQVPFVKVDRHGIEHIVDLHWRVSNPQVFSNLLSLEELAAQAVPVPQLGETARAFAPVHALIVACIHRAAHHPGRDRLIWLYDIHLLAGRLGTVEAGEFVRLATAKRITAVCADGIARARSELWTTLAPVLLALSESHHLHDEPSAEYLRKGLRKIDVLRSDLRALGWSDRLHLLREHLLPPAVYMEQVYGVSNRLLLPVFYAKRFVEGARAWFRAGSSPAA